MANILEFLRGILTDAEIRGAFQADPTGFLQRTGFGDLTGEDVAEAVAVVRRSLPPPAANALAAFEEDDDFTAVQPRAGERELDAAARVLLYAIGQVPLGGPTSAAPAPTRPSAPVPPPAPPPPPPPAPTAAQPATAAPTSSPAHAAPTPTSTATPAPAAAPRTAASASAAAPIDFPSQSSVNAFSETMHTILTETKARLTDVLRQAAQDADRIRAEAEAEVAQARSEAAEDRDAARAYVERSRTEADAALERSKEALADAHRQREELLEASRAELEAARREIDARRNELREAERQLRDRLGGIESLFRTVLREDGPPDEAPLDDDDERLDEPLDDDERLGYEDDDLAIGASDPNRPYDHGDSL